MINVRKLSDEKALELISKIRETESQGNKLGIMTWAILDELEKWMELTPKERQESRERDRLAKEVSKKRYAFREKYLLPNDYELKGDIEATFEDIERVLEEYGPILQGQKNPRYNIFPSTYGNNFKDDGNLPELLVERLDPTLNFIDETILFRNTWLEINPKKMQEYENFAIGGKCKGLYLPKTMVRFFNEDSNIFAAISPIEDDKIREWYNLYGNQRFC